MAQWGLAKNARTTPHLYGPHSRPPTSNLMEPSNVILVPENAAERPFFGMKRTVVANLTDGNEVPPTTASGS